MRGVLSRYVPIVFATIQLPFTCTASLSLKPRPMPAAPRAPARTLSSTRRRMLYMTKTPTTFLSKRLRRTTESCAYMKCVP